METVFLAQRAGIQFPLLSTFESLHYVMVESESKTQGPSEPYSFLSIHWDARYGSTNVLRNVDRIQVRVGRLSAWLQ
jgi:hypothetical protein